nr:hypothetical protein [Tanacetum cinerariifolium]
MQDLIECANNTEMEDIKSTGLFFTWIKSPSKPDTNHSAAILSFPKRITRTRRAFRFNNYVVNKEEFIPNGNLAEKVELCKGKLKDAQEKMTGNPHDKDAKVKEAECLADYFLALEDEEKFMFQKAKVDWISSGDRNTKYFYKVIASKRNINRIMSACNEKGERSEGNLVADQFVQHFLRFL